MARDTIILKALKIDKTVFSFHDLLIRFPQEDVHNFQEKINYYVKTGDLYRIRKGLYALDKNYNKLEVANKIFIPSYISFETVLFSSGLIYQYYKDIFIASYLKRSVEADGQTYVYRKLKMEILVNTSGIILEKAYSIASTERAFLDMLYNEKDFYFDTLLPLKWDKVFEILPIYQNKRLEKRVNKLYKISKSE